MGGVVNSAQKKEKAKKKRAGSCWPQKVTETAESGPFGMVGNVWLICLGDGDE